MPSTIKVLNQDVLIHPIEGNEPIGLIHTPDQSKKRINQGLIVGLGPNIPADAGLEISDHVVFSGYTGDQIVLADGGIFYVAHYSHIDAVLADTDVVLMDSKQVKKIIRIRFAELLKREAAGAPLNLNAIEESLIDRVNSWAIAEGFEF